MHFYTYLTAFIVMSVIHGIKNNVKSAKKVAVIGAGAAGLAFGRVGKSLFDVDIYEASGNVGGVWKYSNGVNNVMYSGLVTNLPKTIMQFSDDDVFTGESSSSSFATHTEVQSYLEGYCAKHDLASLVSFNTRVTSVCRCGEIWEVESLKDGSDELRCSRYDAVVVCNGHYAAAAVPQVEGIQEFTGVTMHSVDYDSNMAESTFANKRVVIVGARASATDIAREIARTAKRIVVADRGLNSLAADEAVDYKHGVLSHRPGIELFTGGNRLRLADGSTEEADYVIWCTGYDYRFEFLGQELVTSEDRAVRPLYEHVFHVDDPSLSFIGLPHSVVPFPLFLLQANWIAQVLSGTVELPNAKERRNWLNRFESELKIWRNYHYMGDEQWAYCRSIATRGAIMTPALTSYLATSEAIYNDNKLAMPDYPGGPDVYRSRLFREVDRAHGTFTVLEPPTDG